jgi:hypothetical protein
LRRTCENAREMVDSRELQEFVHLAGCHIIDFLWR